MHASADAARRWTRGVLAGLLGLALLPLAAPDARGAGEPITTPGVVYTETNAAEGNAIAVFRRTADGMLAPAAIVPTGGAGTGAGLGSQGALALSDDGRRLFAVNAGSNDISAFVVGPFGLQLVGTTPSGGTMPISLALRGGLLYVLNAGGINNITGFTVDPAGVLTAIPDSTRLLSGPSVSPAEVAFSPSGDVLVVTEKGTSVIDTYTVGSDGRPTGPMPQPSSGATPFGFAFDRRGTLIVSEASGSVSSYGVAEDGVLSVVTASAPTHQAAPCWIAIRPGQRYAYTTNAHGGIISGFAIGHDGSLQILNADGITANTGAGSGPLDMAFSVNGRYLYALLSGRGVLAEFGVNEDGSLEPLGAAGSLPAFASGLAAR